MQLKSFRRIAVTAGLALSLSGGAMALAAPGADTGRGTTCPDSTQTDTTPVTNPVSGYQQVGPSPVSVAAGPGGVGVAVGQDCRGGQTDVGTVSVSQSGIYGEDYTAGDQIAGAVRALPPGIVPPNANCPQGSNDCDAVLVHG